MLFIGGRTMKKNRFASLLLTGKVATLPLLISQARADVTPTYQNVIASPDQGLNILRLVELPFANTALKTQSIDTDSNYAGGSAYAAFLCNNLSPSNAFNFAVVGVHEGETAYLVAASNKNDSANLALDSRLTIGSQGLKILAYTTMAPAPLGVIRPITTMTVNFSINTPDLTGVAQNGRVYVQAVTIPAANSGGANPVNWRYSELDEIRVGTCSTTAYGTTIY
jgi:hypothetical protein